MLDREKLERLGLTVVAPSDDDEATSVVQFTSRETVEALKAGLKKTGRRPVPPEDVI
jgi:hypothetical protein